MLRSTRVPLALAIALLMTASAIGALAATDGSERPGLVVGGADASDGAASAASSTMFSDLSHVARHDPGDVRDIEVHGTLAYVSGHHGFSIYDISDPTAPLRVGYLGCPGRDVTVVGAVAAIVGEGGAGACEANGGVHIVDVSDPTDPRFVKHFFVPAHTITAYGDTGIIHVSSQYLYPHISGPLTSSGFQDIIQADTPQDAKLLPRFHFPTVAENGNPVNAPSCHEITFRVDLDRGYCAALVETHIWDTTDPTKPKVLSVIKNPSISIHHGALLVGPDNDILVLNDEFGGALVNACFPGSQGKNPNGALWFYDVSDEALPVVQSWVALQSQSVNSPTARCTSHFGSELPNQQQLVWPWYSGGAVLVDFSNILDPKVLDSHVVPGADTWAAYYHDDGHVYTGDMKRGFEVFALS